MMITRDEIPLFLSGVSFGLIPIAIIAGFIQLADNPIKSFSMFGCAIAFTLSGISLLINYRRQI